MSASGRLWPVVLGIAAVALVLVATSRFGAGVSPDSAAYVSAARSIVAGEGVTMYDGRPMLSWPPAWPAVLAVPTALGIDPVAAGRWINAAVFGLIVGMAVWWLRGLVQSRALFVLGSAAVLFSEPVFYVSTWVWTEPTFILHSYVTLRFLREFRAEGNARDLVFACLFAILAILTRFAGVCLIACGVWLILTCQRLSLRRRITSAAVLIALTGLPLLAWMARTRIQSGSPTGTFAVGLGSVWVRLGELVVTWSGWLFPAFVPETVRVAATALIIAGVAFLLLLYAVVGARSSTRVVELTLPPVGFLVFYTLTLVVLGAVFPFAYLDDRYLSPIYIPIVVLFVHLLDRLRIMFMAGIRLHVIRLVTIVFGLWLVYPVVDAVHATSRCLRQGAGGYATVEWQDSETIDALRRGRFEGAIYSNGPDAIYALTGIEARLTPRVLWGSSLGSAATSLPEFLGAIGEDSLSTIVWFNTLDRRWLHSLEEIGFSAPLDTIETASDGLILRCRSRGSDREPRAGTGPPDTRSNTD